ncbi:hypothetical protein P153DRAFT_367390 [Dothidotthia symphoricarpi CBS 119687]|uniref:Uncharacterized protein n=1 Tax=Dothidotthia symphoricarpi CBS 119687 TaxID=1392245 RepID=A0A6A6ACX3_9PLEO|nr:uncharacterized protein P153DRAFT_367390 [Dothidotthia symphoricarpi CBS 119687]KAF2129113.1 hypothetical protein P153DRAFT_367390 [Dothidotthia symphoricarpi CBS 119687]
MKFFASKQSTTLIHPLEIYICVPILSPIDIHSSDKPPVHAPTSKPTHCPIYRHQQHITSRSNKPSVSQ